MSEREPGDLDRLVFYTDAVCAIAMTLLILPLMEQVSAAAERGLDVAGYLRANANALISFALSFVIIARFWRSHHRLFGRVGRETPGLFAMNLLWLFAIVFLPVATAITGALPSERGEYALYIGTMLLAAVTHAAMTMLVRARPESWRTDVEITAADVRSAWVVSGLLAAALAIALVWPAAGYWSLLVLLVAGPIRWLRRGR